MVQTLGSIVEQAVRSKGGEEYDDHVQKRPGVPYGPAGRSWRALGEGYVIQTLKRLSDEDLVDVVPGPGAKDAIQWYVYWTDQLLMVHVDAMEQELAFDRLPCPIEANGPPLEEWWVNGTPYVYPPVFREFSISRSPWTELSSTWNHLQSYFLFPEEYETPEMVQHILHRRAQQLINWHVMKLTMVCDQIDVEDRRDSLYRLLWYREK